MQTYDESNERRQCLEDSINELNKINKGLAKLTLRKEELTNLIIGALGHNHEGQKSYEYDVWKIEVKTPVIYSLNKKCYEEISYNLPENFNPIKQSVSYTIDKRLCDKYMDEAPYEVQEVLAELIEKKPGKPGITIRERI